MDDLNYKTWMNFKAYLHSGEWHIHTSYTDGRNTVFEYCYKAMNEGIPLLAFTEHVRRELDYDFCQFLDDVERARSYFNLVILSGCEAKVLPGGQLDVQDWLLQEVEYPVFAFHSFPLDIGEYISSLKTVLKNRHINAWAHPGLFLNRHGLTLSDAELTDIFKIMSECNILLEVNDKHKMPSSRWLNLANACNVQLVKAGDIHFVDDLSKEYTLNRFVQPG